MGFADPNTPAPSLEQLAAVVFPWDTNTRAFSLSDDHAEPFAALGDVVICSPAITVACEVPDGTPCVGFVSHAGHTLSVGVGILEHLPDGRPVLRRFNRAHEPAILDPGDTIAPVVARVCRDYLRVNARPKPNAG
jgi:hypothetical protein